MASKDYYEILGINKNATKDEIKKAFHKLAHKFHPDKNSGDDIKFKEVNEAYQTLSDDTKRAQYDQFGSDGPQGFGGGANYGGFGGFDFSGSGFGNQAGFDMGDLGDIFGDFFGGGMHNKPRQKKGRDILTEINIQMSELILGVDKNIKIKKVSKCDTCNGKGGALGEKEISCNKCSGKGRLTRIRKTILGAIQESYECEECDGEGSIVKNKCKSCHGSGGITKDSEFKVNIPAGSNNGDTLRLTGAGEYIKSGFSGDLFIKLKLIFPKKLSDKQKKLLEEMQKEGL